MTASTALANRPLAPGARFELTDDARRKLQPRNRTAGVIVADASDCWKCRFDGQAFNRLVAKGFVRAEEDRRDLGTLGGFVRKGGHNDTSAITTRPQPPAPMKSIAATAKTGPRDDE